ncbi:MAG: hypothetical protein K2Q23_11445 [Bryobacteraceae bacterium]|nr:hypothetical protein [Bryobacteraceae bacterium]
MTRAVEDRGASMSGVVEAALTALLGDKTRNSELALLGERVTKLARAAERIADETTAQTETLALYILYYLCITPPLPDASRDAAEAMGRKRFDRFIGQVSERLLGKESYTDEVLARIDLVRANSAPKLGVAS